MMNKILLFSFFLCSLFVKSQVLKTTIDVVNQNCNLGEVRINASGGTGAYVYAIALSNTLPSPSSFSETNVFNVSSGEYDVYVRDNEGNIGFSEVKKTVEVIPVPPLEFSIEVNNPICNGTDGSVNIFASGGSGSYQYQIENSVGVVIHAYSYNSSFDNLTTGLYKVFVIDSDGCTLYNEFTITEPPALFVSTIVNQPICNGDTGSFIVQATGGSGSYEYSLYSSENVFQTYSVNNVFNELTAGDYNLFVRDSMGCIESSQITINESLALSNSASLTQSYSCTTKGEITFEPATGGLPPYQYGVNEVYSPNLIKGNLIEGTYVLTVRDVNGCIVSVGTIIVDPIPEILELSSEITYNCDGTGNVSISPANVNYRYQLNGGLAQSSNLFNTIVPGEHIITVQIAPDCSKDITVNILENKLFASEIINSSNVECNKGNDGEITFKVENYNFSYQYSIDGGVTWATGYESPLTINDLSAGNYNL